MTVVIISIYTVQLIDWLYVVLIMVVFGNPIQVLFGKN